MLKWPSATILFNPQSGYCISSCSKSSFKRHVCKRILFRAILCLFLI